jgi:glycosyltransferase involved in cell wall biosynthesis
MVENRRTRFAVVAPFPPPPAGMSLQADYIARRLEADGAEVIRVDTIPTGKRKPRLLRFPGFYRNLWDIRKCDKAIVFAGSSYGYFAFTTPAVFFAKLTRKEVYVLVKGGMTDVFYARWRFLVIPTLTVSDGVFTPGEFLRRVLAKYNIKARVLPDIIDPDILCNCREPADVSAPRLVIARNLYPIYRVDHAIRAFSLVKREFPAAQLHIAGDGEERNRLERMAGDIGDIYFYGWVGREKLNELLRTATLLVNCNVYDNHPNSIIEAMMIGLPVVAYGVGGIPYIIEDGRTGVLVPSGDIKALADAIIGLVKDPARTERITAEAKAAAPRYFWSFSRRGLMNVFKRNR